MGKDMHEGQKAESIGRLPSDFPPRGICFRTGAPS